MTERIEADNRSDAIARTILVFLQSRDGNSNINDVAEHLLTVEAVARVRTMMAITFLRTRGIIEPGASRGQTVTLTAVGRDINALTYKTGKRGYKRKTDPVLGTPVPKSKPGRPPKDRPKVATDARVRLITPQPLGDGVKIVDWYKDADLVQLATANRPCFGSWVPAHPECDRCPLADSCRGLLVESLRVARTRLTERDLRDDDGTLRELLSSLSDATAPAALRASAEVFTKQEVVVPKKVIDFNSKEPIPEGTRANYVHGSGYTLSPV